jgi:predicted AlkP superfamily phosphohydrolase/phosphomutase
VVQLGGEYHRVRDELIDTLRKAKNPDDGTLLFDWVEPRENIFSGECIDLAPDIVYSLRGYRAVVGEDAEAPTWGPWSQPRAGYHRREGVLIARGPMIKENALINGARIQDIAPTVLACWGLESDEAMDGAVLTDLLKPGFVDANPPRKGNYSTEVCSVTVGDDDSADMEDLMKGLGYLN